MVNSFTTKYESHCKFLVDNLYQDKEFAFYSKFIASPFYYIQLLDFIDYFIGIYQDDYIITIPLSINMMYYIISFCHIKLSWFRTWHDTQQYGRLPHWVL